MTPFSVITGGRADPLPPTPPRTPALPLNDREMEEALRTYRFALTRRPELREVVETLRLLMVCPPDGLDLRDLTELLRGNYRDDSSLVDVLAYWPTMRGPVRRALAALARGAHRSVAIGVREALATLLPTLRDEAAPLAAWVTNTVLQSKGSAATDQQEGARLVANTLSLLTSEQLADVTPFLAA